MLNISIDKEKTIVQNTKTGGQWTVKTTTFFGVVYESLEHNFPNFDPAQMGNMIAAHVCNKLAGRTDEKPTYIFHCEEIGTSLYDLLMFVDGKKELSPTLQDIEELRITHRMTTNYLPISIDEPGSMRFANLKTVTHVMIAALYYYAYNKYKLTRCKHCGRWFATKTLKEEFCENISPCCELTVNGKKVLNATHTCKEAVRIIRQRFADRKKQIYNKWYIDGLEDECQELLDNYYQLSDAIKKEPTVKNIVACMEYLYSDDMPKQERPNRRKSNAEKRKLMGT